MRRHKCVPPTTLPGCCFLHSDNKQWADLRTYKEVKPGCSILEVLMLYPSLPWVHGGTWVTALSLTASSHQKSQPGGTREQQEQFSPSSQERCSTELSSCPGRESSWPGSCWASASPAPVGTRCSAVVFASCLWRPARNDVAGANLSGDPQHQSLPVQQII